MSYTPLKSEPYYLHAILIHEGSGDFGHYMAFIYDRKEEFWYKFNDHNVRVESEDKVMEDAFGNPKTKISAYGLIYVNGEIATS